METLEEVLAHHGIKGMRWGVRRAASSKALSPRQVKRLDKRFDRNAHTFNTALKLHNRAAELTNKNDIDRINNKPQYKDKDFTRDSPLRQKYYAEHQKAFIDNLQKAADEMGTNASGTKKYTILEKPDGSWDVILDDRKAKHADESISVSVKKDSMGHILSLAVIDPVAHGAAIVSDALAHYGVKGMRWGFRKGSGGVSVGRKKTPTSVDFKKAEAARAKIGAKKTGPAAKKTAPLSNEELQALVKRMNLEKQYAELSTKDQHTVAGAHITGKILGGLGKGTGQVAGNIVKSQATKLGNELAAKELEKLLKRAGKK